MGSPSSMLRQLSQIQLVLRLIPGTGTVISDLDTQGLPEATYIQYCLGRKGDGAERHNLTFLIIKSKVGRGPTNSIPSL